ncbi:MAG TPA: tetratricopeptide repeat protein [Polyangia bacterium]|nr:tetratricopeptide repeat protein [Polyangia bacterium]
MALPLAIHLSVLLASARGSAAPAATSPASTVPVGRQTFVVVPFANSSGQGTLDFLRAGLPVLIAERLAGHPALRFVGGGAVVEKGKLEDALARAHAGGVKWVVAGKFDKRPDWKIEVTVDVYVTGSPAARAGQASAVGPKDEVWRTALRAAVEALQAAGVEGVPPDAVLAPFARDPYAFVLFGRGVAAYAGLDGYPVSAERAMKNLTKSLLIDPKVPETRRYLGAIHLGAGRPGHARAMWSTAVELRPRYTAAIAALAALDRTSGLPSARERYARVLELAPDDLDARRAHGELLSEAGMLDEAQAELQLVVAAAPGDLRARRALVLVLASRQAGEALAAELAEVVRLDPDDLDAHLELAAAYTSIGNGELAIASYEEVLRRRPRHAGALKQVADQYRARGDMAKAIASYERLRRVAPDDPRPVFLLGATYYEAGRLDSAEKSFTEGARYPGMLGDAYSNLGAIAIRRQQPKDAIWFLSRAAKRRPDKPGVRYNYALALNALGRFDDASRELVAAAASAPTDPEIHFLSGVVALRQGRVLEAQGHFQETLRLRSDHEAARHNLALLEELQPSTSETSLSIGTLGGSRAPREELGPAKPSLPHAR